MEIVLKNFKLNSEGTFSITRPHESQQISHFIENFIRVNEDDNVCDQDRSGLSDKIITDATACMGGDLVKFSKRAKYVNGVEIDPENFKLLLENCKIFNCQNINLFCQDYLEIYDKLRQDVIYLDPEWGGPGYKTKEFVILKLGDIEIYELIRLIKEKNLAKYIFVKAPLNVCMDNLEYDSIHMIFNKSKIPSFKLICIRV